MLIIPAIDILDGCVVRFVQGRLNKKIYSSDPVKTAKHWENAGGKMLHVVDLDGAISGVPKNIDIVKKIARNIKIPVEFGGGVRKLKTIKELIDSGISRVILGTKAVSEKEFLKKAVKEFKEKVIVSIDAKNGKVAIKGWRSSDNNMDVLEFACYLKKTGLKQIIYTDTLKDGTLTGPNIKGIKELLKVSGLNIIASGGVSGLDDLFKLKKLENQGVTGVIIGKALYEGRFTLNQALEFS
jgi:phosphoribosylformimino-5-aminoimidazole carboxamide ribotide isomerase